LNGRTVCPDLRSQSKLGENPKEIFVNKIERVRAALKNEEVDRPPFSFWYHFGLQHRPGRDHARVEIEFYRAYDLDFLKVMNDYPFPLPSGFESLDTKAGWERLEPVKGDNPCWNEQLTALEMIGDEIGQEAMFIETIFCPWTTARRLARSGGLAVAIREYPESLLAAMNSITISLSEYTRQALKRGASGIFLSIGAASGDVMSADDYESWGRPFDLRVLQSAAEAAFNVAHVHGKQIHFDSVSDFPATAFNWSHFATSPSLEDGKKKSGKAVMGGINEAIASHVSAAEIRDQVLSSIKEVGRRGILITPGCSVPTDTREASLKSIKSAIESIKY